MKTELEQLRDRRDYLKQELEDAQSALSQVLEDLAELEPPFEVGQTVRVSSTNGAARVDGVERAFGEWVVKVHFESNSRPYYYPANALIRMEEYTG